MHRIFVQEISSQENHVVLRDEKARYLFSVLRCKTGDDLIVTDKNGCSFTAKVVYSSKREVALNITGDYAMDTESGLNIILCQGLLKGEKMDLVIQKATELGVYAIVPVITERSQLRETRKHPRWKKIAEEASRQSCRANVPEIFYTYSYSDIFNVKGLLSGNGIIFWEKMGQKLPALISRLPHSDTICLLVGPEGGFSEKEVSTATEKGFHTASLGNRILRAETASIAVVSIVQFAMGDMG